MTCPGLRLEQHSEIHSQSQKRDETCFHTNPVCSTVSVAVCSRPAIFQTLPCAYFVNSDLKYMLLPIQVAQSVALGVELLNAQIFCHSQVVAVYKFWFSERMFLEARVELN